MKNYKQILEAVNRGIRLALDDYENIEDNSSVSHYNDVIDDTDFKKVIFLRKNFVNMGFPSGTWWGKFNIGYLTNSSDIYGDYYAWGELKPNKQYYSWDTYDLAVSTLNTDIYNMSKYTVNDKIKVLEDQDDIVTQLYGDHYAMPTQEQFEELLEYTTHEWTIKHYKGQEIQGGLFISKINQNKIFLPAGGDIQYDGFAGKNEYGCYWSKTLVDKFANDADAVDLYFQKNSNNNDCELCRDSRYFGYNIRPIYNR